jgi:hypothetical protein
MGREVVTDERTPVMPDHVEVVGRRLVRQR